MGDIAEQHILDEMFYGRDSTGQNIYRKNGSINRPWSQRSGAKRKDAVKGVINLMSHKGIVNENIQRALLSKYADEHNIPRHQNKWITSVCVEIQKQFETFVKWLNHELGLPNYGKAQTKRK